MPDLTVLAVDLGGSHAACAVVRSGVILAEKSFPADGGSCIVSLPPALGETLFGSSAVLPGAIPLMEYSL